jgi:hypothetical protein
MNLYAYAYGNPLRYIDPGGRRAVVPSSLLPKWLEPTEGRICPISTDEDGFCEKIRAMCRAKCSNEVLSIPRTSQRMLFPDATTVVR